MDKEHVEIRATFRQNRDRSIAIWTGELDEYGGQVWIFLPKSQIRYERQGADVTITLPHWLAKRRNLLSASRRFDHLERRIDDLLEAIDQLDDRLETIEGRLKRIEVHFGFDKARH